MAGMTALFLLHGISGVADMILVGPSEVHLSSMGSTTDEIRTSESRRDFKFDVLYGHHSVRLEVVWQKAGCEGMAANSCCDNAY